MAYMNLKEAQLLTEDRLLELLGHNSIVYLEFLETTIHRGLHQRLWDLNRLSRKVRINMAMNHGQGWMLDPNNGTKPFSMLIVERKVSKRAANSR
ncbi:MAG: hypothetical protein WAX89_01845 [Alphaproteobacteria bacterium]